MKRHFRPAAYTVTVIALLVALLIREPDASFQVVHATPRNASPPRAADSPDVPRLARRPTAALSPRLFATRAKAVELQVEQIDAIPVMAPEDIKVLGWMLSDVDPYIFVDWQDENYTLSPSQSVGDTYRFDRIGGGFADFTYLPTGATRQYAVSDPALEE